jgi:hypothetical protein
MRLTAMHNYKITPAKKENTKKYSVLNGDKPTVLREPLVSRLVCSWKILETYFSNQLHDTKNTQQRRNNVQRGKEIRPRKKHREDKGKGKRKGNLTVTCRMEAIQYSEKEFLFFCSDRTEKTSVKEKQ